MIEALWKIALADGERDAEEDALIRLGGKPAGHHRRRQRQSAPKESADMIAGLPMYDRSELRDAHDRFLERIIRNKFRVLVRTSLSNPKNDLAIVLAVKMNFAAWANMRHAL